MVGILYTFDGSSISREPKSLAERDRSNASVLNRPGYFAFSFSSDSTVKQFRSVGGSLRSRRSITLSAAFRLFNASFLFTGSPWEWFLKKGDVVKLFLF